MVVNYSDLLLDLKRRICSSGISVAVTLISASAGAEVKRVPMSERLYS